MTEKEKQIRAIVIERQASKIENVLVDMLTASMLVRILENLNTENQGKFLAMPIQKMVSVGWKLIQKK